jgi:hypothetical protein
MEDAVLPRLTVSRGTRLSETGAVDEWRLRRLRALGVNTVEELLGLIRSSPAATSRFIDVPHLAALQADLVATAATPLLAAMEQLHEETFALGAVAPEDVDVETEALEETFERFLATFPPEQEPPPGPEIVEFLGCFEPIRNQGRRGTCVAHTVAAMMECLLSRRGDRVDLSEQWLYWRCKEADGEPDGEGTPLYIGMQETVETGVCLEELWPYEPDPIAGNEGQGPPPSGAPEDAAGRTMSGWEQLAYRSSEAIKAALDQSRPVAVAVPVYENWYTNDSTKVTGEIEMPLPHSVLKGGHAMCVAGYGYDPDLPGGAGFIVRNSWGSVWAPDSPIRAGYGVLPFPYVDFYGWGAFTFRD